MASEMRKRSCCVRDRISLLPDEILGEILSLIPTRDVVKTSTLSKRWKREWTFVPAVQLQDIHLFSGKLVSEVDKAGFINYFEGVLNQVTFLRRLELRSSCFYDKSRLKQLIHLILAKLQNHNHNNNNVALEELDLKFAAQTVKLPPSIFTCKTLVLLKISFFVELKFPSMVCLPSLKVLHLRPSYPHWDNMKCMDVSSVENILAGCPNLEELVLDVGGPIRNRLRKERLCVKSSCLKRLTLDLDVVLRIEIEASNLEQLVLKFDMPKQSVFLITSLPLLTRARLIQCSEVGAEDKDYCGKTLIELLRKVSHTKDLFLSFNATMCLELYQQVPIFKNLVHLEAQAFSSRLPILPCLLKNCPNLVSFTLKAVGIPLLQSHSTPNCLTTTTMLHRLQKVDLSYDEACEHEMEVVTYFMKNAPVLKKMIAVFKSRTMDKKEASLLYNSILNIPKASLACEVVAKIYGSKSKIIFP